MQRHWFVIEVEKKFFLPVEKIAAVLEGATKIQTRSYTDAYFDNATHDLTRRDIWLRWRDNRWQLKFPWRDVGRTRTGQYDGTDDPLEIARKLGVSLAKPLRDALTEAGYFSYARFTTLRTEYERKPFVIDIDSMDFGFSIVEIELMVEHPSQVESGVARILEFAQGLGLQLTHVRGKVVEYLQRHNPAHLQALVQAGVIER